MTPAINPASKERKKELQSSNRILSLRLFLRSGVTTTILITAIFGYVAARAASPQATPAEFAVLRSERVTQWIAKGTQANLNCSILGSGNSAQIHCLSSEYSTGIPLVYNVSLVVGSNHVGYVIACGGGLLRRIGCEPLTAGQALRGIIDGGKLTVPVGGKSKSYRIITSQYIGPIVPEQPTVVPAPQPSTPPAILQTTSQRASQASSAQPDKPANPGKGKVSLNSDPQGADIYVDDKFVGDTPSTLELTQGNHTMHVEASGYEPWVRDLEVAAGNEVTLQPKLKSRK